ncbi:imidazole glycerol phosphate synthase subunit HisH, partial [Pelagibacteraceae bacterium]|nr:imidazole glycerol phosphate synthase subunit HisH [Pelagibacteraceae bacterium]
YKTIITNSKKDIISSDLIVLPGVGAFNKAISNLKKMKIFDTIQSIYVNKKPMLSICLGLQMLFENSEEFGNSTGLSIIKGNVHSFKNFNNKIIIPHVGWNSVKINSENKRLMNFSNLKKNFSNNKFYFIHSYFVKPKYKNDILTSSNYNGYNFCSSILKNNLLACQFHPEKSGENGLKLIDSFVRSTV